MIEIISATENPLSTMGRVASECYNSKPSKQIGINCIKSGHGRVSEYAHIIVKFSEYSARVMRELYTHIIGTSRLQSSTRYINYENFDFFTPYDIENNGINYKYMEIMENIMSGYQELIDAGISKQDAANVLPLGMHTTVVLKINARALIHMFETRTCSRAYEEFRTLMNDLSIKITSELDDEWRELADLSFQTKCEKVGYCTEERSCGRMPKKEEVL